MEGLWKQVAMVGVRRDGWDLPSSSALNSAFWEAYLTVWVAFLDSIRFRVGSGDRILFWKDKWWGDSPLVYQFLELFRCVHDK